MKTKIITEFSEFVEDPGKIVELDVYLRKPRKSFVVFKFLSEEGKMYGCAVSGGAKWLYEKLLEYQKT